MKMDQKLLDNAYGIIIAAAETYIHTTTFSSDSEKQEISRALDIVKSDFYKIVYDESSHYDRPKGGNADE